MMAAPADTYPDSPTAMAIAEQRRRFSYLLVAGGIITLVMALTVIIFIGPVLGGLDLLAGSGMLALRHWGLSVAGTRRLHPALHLVALLAFATIVGNAWVTGQSHSFVMWFLPTLPLVVAFIGGRRLGLLWAGISMLTAVAMGIATGFVPFTSIYLPDTPLLVISHLALTAVSTAYSLAVQHSNDTHVTELDTAYQTLLAQKQLIARQADALANSLAAKQAANLARETAENANRAKSEFLATISHEIRTPLSGVVGLNSLLLDTALNSEQRRYADLARLSGEALMHLINDLLDFSKIEAGRLELEPLVFDPNQLAQETLRVVQVSAEEKNIPLRQDISAPRRLRGDPARLRQILMNLLGNAVKFTEHGEITLACRELQGSGEKTWLRFEVRDSGIGIDEETQAKLFQPFTQADASTTRRFGGTGLGLAISRALTELMHGRIGLCSTPGQGSTFWVELPFDALPEEVPCEAGAPRAAPLPLSLQGHVLLVEDNAVNQFIAAEMLKRLNCQVDIAGNGAEALAAIGRHTYHLVFMDCDMPVLDGYAATRAIRAGEPPGTHLPIVAMTASALKGDREKCLEAGMDDYLSKPVRPDDFGKMLRRWVLKSGDNGSPGG